MAENKHSKSKLGRETVLSPHRKKGYPRELLGWLKLVDP
jgi:hypothetical protein